MLALYCAVGYALFAVMVGYNLAKLSLRVLARPGDYPFWTKICLFPWATECSSYNEPVELITDYDASLFAVCDFHVSFLVNDTVEARRARARYIVATIIMLPVRLTFSIPSAALFLLWHLGAYTWQRTGQKMFNRAVNSCASNI